MQFKLLPHNSKWTTEFRSSSSQWWVSSARATSQRGAAAAEPIAYLQMWTKQNRRLLTSEEHGATNFSGIFLDLLSSLPWALKTSSVTKIARQHLYFLQRLREVHLIPPMINYRGTIKSILSSHITGCTVLHRRTLQHIAWTAENINRISLSSIMDTSHTAPTKQPALCMTPITPHTNSSYRQYLILMFCIICYVYK